MSTVHSISRFREDDTTVGNLSLDPVVRPQDDKESSLRTQ